MKRTIIIKKNGVPAIAYSIGIAYKIGYDHTIKLVNMLYVKKDNEFCFNENIPKKYRKYDGKRFTPKLDEILKINNILDYQIWEESILKFYELCEDMTILKQCILYGKINF